MPSISTRQKKAPKVRYGVLDEFGEVLRWQWSKPTCNFKYLTERLNRRPVVDWSNFEQALF